jgi:hypothetical protein
MAHQELWGQWIGSFSGPVAGLAHLNIERSKSRTPFICVIQDVNGIVSTRIAMIFEYQGSTFSGKSTEVLAYDAATNNLLSAEDYMKRANNQVQLADWITIEGDYTTHSFRGKWRSSNFPEGGDFELLNPANRLVDQPNRICSWQEFRAIVDNPQKRNPGWIFRGQASNLWRLKTTFHREKRYDLSHYWNAVCPTLRDRFAAINEHHDLSIPNELGSLICKAQHHGFPTPLLDWTSDPYVAAFFAFNRTPSISSPNHCCRIFILDALSWAKNTTHIPSLSDPKPLVILRTFDPSKNPRQEAQKCHHLFSNIEDIEFWIRSTEQVLKKGSDLPYLFTIDIPWNQTKEAKRDLREMGITDHKLFLGLDALCRTLREDLFEGDS